MSFVTILDAQVADDINALPRAGDDSDGEIVHLTVIAMHSCSLRNVLCLPSIDYRSQ